MPSFQIGERFKQDVRNARVIGEFTVKIGAQKLPGMIWQVVSRLRASAYPDTQPRIRPTDISHEPVSNHEAQPTPNQPLADYDLLTGSQISELLPTLDAPTLENIVGYESQTRKRHTIISAAQQLLAQS